MRAQHFADELLGRLRRAAEQAQPAQAADDLGFAATVHQPQCGTFELDREHATLVYRTATTRLKWSTTSPSTTRRTPSTRHCGSFSCSPRRMISSRDVPGGTVNVDWLMI